MKRFLLLPLCLLALACVAHEYILLAAKYRLEKGDDLEAHLFVADGFNVQMERPYQADKTLAFELLTKAGKTDLRTANGTLPVLNRKVDFDGGGLLHMERGYARITLPNQKFLDYLKEDHIEDIAERIDRTKPAQRERYTRYIKCLVQSGSTLTDTVYKTATGQTFEVVLLQNPYGLKEGDKLRVQLLFRGAPLANKILTARNRIGNESVITTTKRTDAAGICTIGLPRKGEWFLHATHMIPCPDTTDADWESFWATYSFGLE